MRIYWDSYGLQSLHSGVGHHAYALHSSLRRLGVAPTVLSSALPVDPAFSPFLSSYPSHASSRLQQLKPLALWRAGLVLKGLASAEPSLIHGLSNYNLPSVPSGGRWRQVLTVHDLIPWFAPDQVSSALRLFLQWQMPRALRRADAIICVSRWTLETLEDRFPFVRGRTILIPNGLDAPLRERENPINDQHFRLLTVSRSEGYKRLSRIGELLRILPQDYVWDIVTDAKGRRELSASFPDLSHRWRIHVGIDDAALDQLVGSAHTYVHPSLYEGYCLPAARAIQGGKPVVYTSGSGIDETVGEAGIGIEPTASLETWLSAVVSLASQAQRWEAVCRLHCRQLPTGDEVAARTLAVYGMLVE